MTRLGLDEREVERLAGSFRVEATALQQGRRRLADHHRALRGGWRGPDAARFERDLTHDALARMDALGEHLRSISRSLDHHLAEQRSASRAEVPPGPLRPPPDRLEQPGMPAAIRGELERLPRVEERFRLGLDAKGQIIAGEMEMSIVLTQLRDGTWVGGHHVGLGGGVGVAGLSVTAGLEGTTGWEGSSRDEARAHAVEAALIAAATAPHGIDLPSIMNRLDQVPIGDPRSALADAVDEVSHVGPWLRDAVEADGRMPRPDVYGVGVYNTAALEWEGETPVGADAFGSMLSGLATLSTSSRIALQYAPGVGHSITLGADVAGSIGAGLSEGAGFLGFELPDGAGVVAEGALNFDENGTLQTLVVTTTMTGVAAQGPGTVKKQTAILDLSDPEVAGGVRSALRNTSGDPAAYLSRLVTALSAAPGRVFEQTGTERSFNGRFSRAGIGGGYDQRTIEWNEPTPVRPKTDSARR